MGSYQKAPQKGITKLQYFLRGSFVLFLFQLTIVLVSDGSTDASAEICERFSELDSRVRVFHTENRGAALAKNFGVTQALGEYVLFVDSDDIAEKRMVDTLQR